MSGIDTTLALKELTCNSSNIFARKDAMIMSVLIIVVQRYHFLNFRNNQRKPNKVP